MNNLRNLFFKIILKPLSKNYLFYLAGIFGLYFNFSILELENFDLVNYLLIYVIANISISFFDFRFYEKVTILKSFWSSFKYNDFGLFFEFIISIIISIPISLYLYYIGSFNYIYIIFLIIYTFSNISIAHYSRVKIPSIYEATSMGGNFLIKMCTYFGVILFEFNLTIIFSMAILKELIVFFIRIHFLRINFIIPTKKLIRQVFFEYKDGFFTSLIKSFRNKIDSLIIYNFLGENTFVFYRKIQIYANSATMLYSPVTSRLVKEYASNFSKEIKTSSYFLVNLLLSSIVSLIVLSFSIYFYESILIYEMILIFVISLFSTFVVYPCSTLRYHIAKYNLIHKDNIIMLFSSIIIYMSFLLNIISLNVFIILIYSYGFLQLLIFKNIRKKF